MNAKEAKEIPLDFILDCLGYQSSKEYRDELLYRSPFRKENVPSFFLNRSKNIWYDFGHGEGGNVLDFIMAYYQISDVSTALISLSKLIGSSEQKIESTLRTPTTVTETSPLQISKIQSLQNKALIQYLQERGIPRQTASAYVSEIYYQLVKGNQKKSYFALAFRNLSGGYELRNRYFKGGIGKKDISLLAKRKRGDESIKSQAVTVFEGFMDFLSALCFYAVSHAKTEVIILNSVFLKDRAIERIYAKRFISVYLYLDRDESGKKIAADFRKQLRPDVTIIDKSDLYRGYKDFNEFLVASPQ